MKNIPNIGALKTLSKSLQKTVLSSPNSTTLEDCTTLIEQWHTDNIKHMNVCGSSDLTYIVGDQEKTAVPMARLPKHLLQSQQYFSLTDTGLQQQISIFGSAGAGMTETCVSMLDECVQRDKGCVYIDGKGDNSLWSKIFSVAEKHNKIDRLKVINLMTGGRDIERKWGITHSVNVLAHMNEARLTQWMEDVCEAGQSTHPNLQQVKEHAAPLARAFLQEAKTEHLRFTHMLNTKYQDNIINIWKEYIRPLVETYGYLFDDAKSDIHLISSVLNKDIIVVLLPSLMKSSDETKITSSILMASLYQATMMAPKNNQVDTVMFFHDHAYMSCETIKQRLSRVTNKAFGMVWAGMYGYYDWESDFPVIHTKTNIFMRMEKDSPIKHFPQMKTSDFSEGEAIICHGDYVSEKLTMVYHPQKIPKRLFIPLAQPSLMPSYSMDDATIQRRAKILHTNWEACGTLHGAQETVARMFGCNDWHEAISITKNQ